MSKPFDIQAHRSDGWTRGSWTLIFDDHLSGFEQKKYTAARKGAKDGNGPLRVLACPQKRATKRHAKENCNQLDGDKTHGRANGGVARASHGVLSARWTSKMDNRVAGCRLHGPVPCRRYRTPLFQPIHRWTAGASAHLTSAGPFKLFVLFGRLSLLYLFVCCSILQLLSLFLYFIHFWYCKNESISIKGNLFPNPLFVPCDLFFNVKKCNIMGQINWFSNDIVTLII